MDRSLLWAGVIVLAMGIATAMGRAAERTEQSAASVGLKAWVPLALAMLQVLWVAAIILPMLGVGQSRPVTYDALQMRAITVLAMLPALIGLLLGARLLVRRQRLSRPGRFGLGLGLLANAAWVLAFASDLV